MCLLEISTVLRFFFNLSFGYSISNFSRNPNGIFVCSFWDDEQVNEQPAEAPKSWKNYQKKRRKTPAFRCGDIRRTLTGISFLLCCLYI